MQRQLPAKRFHQGIDRQFEIHTMPTFPFSKIIAPPQRPNTKITSQFRMYTEIRRFAFSNVILMPMERPLIIQRTKSPTIRAISNSPTTNPKVKRRRTVRVMAASEISTPPSVLTVPAHAKSTETVNAISAQGLQTYRGQLHRVQSQHQW